MAQNKGKPHKIEFYVPAAHADAVCAAMFAAGAGAIGNYDQCCWRTAGRGQFRPLPGSSPAIGKVGQTEQVEELKVEMVCEGGKLDAAIQALLAAHPYETPAFQYWQVELSSPSTPRKRPGGRRQRQRESNRLDHG